MDLKAAHIIHTIIIFLSCYIHASQSQSSAGQNNADISTTSVIPDFTTSLLPSGCHIATDQHLSCFKVEQFPRLSPKTASQITSIVIKDCSVDLGSLDETHFSEYTNLQILTITKCGLSHVHPTTFINNQKLKNIDFSNNKLETISYAVVLSIRRPESINLMNNSFVCNCSMVWIGILSRIKDFDLNITGFPTCGPPDDLKSLKSLILPDCVPPQTQITSSIRTLNLTPGDELILSCTAPAQPPARINWVTESIASDFELINEGTQNVTLKIKNISAEDNGYFNCFGNNSVIRKSAKVEVQINLPAKIMDLRLFEDGDCLRYLISGTPPYNITWQHNGDLIQNGFWNDQICTRGVCKEYHTQSGCMTWSAGRRTGLYRLSVHNEFGADERRVQIGIHGNYSLLPVPPGSSFTVRAATSEPVTRRPNQVEDKPEENEKSVYMQIIAPVVGCLLVLAIIIIACYVKNRKKFYSKSKVLGLDGNRLELSPLSEMPDMMENPNYQLLSKRTTQKLRIINIDQLIFIKELGEGAFGRVYLGSCINLFTGDERTMVAIKTLKSTVTEDAIKNFEYEAELMAEITHENIVSLYGISYNGEHLMMIFEYMENRDLNNYLRCNGPDALSLGYQTWNSSPLLISDLLFIAKQIAAGMSYLSSRHFVHRDLATRNCLVGEKLIVKIGDFGMSRDIYSSDYYKVGGQTMLPIRWMPPESVLYRKFSVESDVWSFGVVLWEIFSYGRQPWFELSNMEVIEHIKDGQLLSKPDECTEEIYELMLSCWSRQPTDRASMSELHDILCGFLSPQSPYNNNSRALLNKENSFIPSI